MRFIRRLEPAWLVLLSIATGTVAAAPAIAAPLPRAALLALFAAGAALILSAWSEGAATERT